MLDLDKKEPPTPPCDESPTLKEIKKKIESGKNLFITGGAGTGKSYTLNQLRKQYKIAVTSTTGISAMNVNGQTIHSWAGIGICNKEIDTVVNEIRYKKQFILNQILNCEILAIDEVSMLDGRTMDYLNEVLKKVRVNLNPFGGIQILAIGDLFQLPPVKAENHFCFESGAWFNANFETIILDKVYRQNDIKFITALNNARIGALTDYDDILLQSRNSHNDKYYINESDILHLFGTNKQADSYNLFKFEKIEEEPTVYHAEDKIKGENIYYAKALEKNCQAPIQLALKPTARVMLLRNTDFSRGLVNGSLGIIESMSEYSILVKFDNGEEEYINKHEFEYWAEGEIKATRKQFPLRLAYGLTIHKSQGMTLDCVRINMERIFAAGQAYVALSRAKSLDGLYLKNYSASRVFADEKIILFYRGLTNNVI
jgi:ATP-dependent DNA helicase PIF1